VVLWTQTSMGAVKNKKWIEFTPVHCIIPKQ